MLQRDTVALPLIKGLDITTDARLVEPPALLEAENTRFTGGGAKKRRGHTVLAGRGPEDLAVNPTANVNLFTAGLLTDYKREAGAEGTRYYRSPNPEQDSWEGIATRDDEVLPWNGYELFSYLPSDLAASAPNLSAVGPAILPNLKATPVGKRGEHQTYPEFADNGSVQLLAWISGSTLKYLLSDSVSGAKIAEGSLAVTSPSYHRVYSMGDWFHVMCLDAGKVVLFSLYSPEPNDITYRTYGDASHFDIWKVSENDMLYVRTNVDGIHITHLASTGAGLPDYSPLTYVPTFSGTFGLISVTSAQTQADEIALAWKDTAGDRLCVAVITSLGAVLAEAAIAGTTSGMVRLTVSSHATVTATGHGLFDVFWDNGTDLRTQRFYVSGAAIAVGTALTRYHQLIASRAFRILDRVFLWTAFSSTLQGTWFLLDEGLSPVGHMDFGVADVSGIGTSRVTGVNWFDAYPTTVQLALNYKLRVTPDGSAQATAGIYTEPSPKAVHLDFLPSLRWAQAGRTTYFAGAQLWAYDGKELVEAGFHTGPEPTLAPSNGGALTLLGTYSYRVDLCHRNAQNEEVRSLSILSNSVALTGAQATITVTLPTVLTRRTDSYFLIYRNAMSSGVPLTEWWLLNSRDPSDASFRANDLSLSTVSFVDAGSVGDVAIQTRELHPATDTYLQPVAAPACEIIASGRDRLWVAGGELATGVVAPSRLFDSGEVPSFNAYLNIQVDRSIQPITAIGFIGEVGVLFRASSCHILDSDGPDNVASGLWNPPRLALADIGAQGQEGLARISHGLLFQSKAGVRLLGPGGALTPVGLEVDDALASLEIASTVVSDADQEVRFYGTSGGTYVFNYLYGNWAHWSCDGAAAKAADGVVIARSNGELWIETAGVWRDGDLPYTHRIRTAWLHGGSLGDFQRVRKVEGIGRAIGAHDLRLEYYYDEREFWEERVDWAWPDSSVNQDTWGAGAWGDGSWGDTSGTTSNPEDLTWDWVRRPSRQKCNVVSLALEDVATDGPGFELSAFVLELARKPGTNRGPERTGTGTYR